MSLNPSSHHTISPQIATLRPLLGNPGESFTTTFISDLHLLSSRCHYARHAEAVRRAVEEADVCVWGGDLFDFCWSCQGDGPTSRRIAIEWLQRWRDEFPEKTFVYLTGNHDAQPEFQVALSNMFGSTHIKHSPSSPPSLAIQPSAMHVGLDAIRIGDCLMVHGDVIEAGGIASELPAYRGRWQHERTGIAHPPKVRNGLYNAAVGARLHLATAGIAHRRKNVCMRLLRWIRSQPDWVGHDVRRIVFGHTHRRLSGVRIAGYEFFNTGAAVKHVPFEPVVLQIQI